MVYITVYDAEQYKRSGYGNRKIQIKSEGMTPDELQKRKKAIQEEWKVRNRAFRIQYRNRPVIRGELKLNNPGDNFEDTVNDVDELLKEDETPPEIVEKISKIRYHNRVMLELDNNTGNTTALIASSKAGKSTMLMEMFRKYYDSSDMITTLFSVNSQIDLYRKAGKNLLRYNRFDDNAQKMIRASKLINTRTKNKYQFCFLFDDVLNAKNSTLFNNLICTYRNSNISTIICLQYTYLLSKSNRCNINNVLLGRLNSDESVEDVVKTFLASFLNKMGILKMRDMIAFYKKATEDHGFIYINTSKNLIKFLRIDI